MHVQNETNLPNKCKNVHFKGLNKVCPSLLNLRADLGSKALELKYNDKTISQISATQTGERMNAPPSLYTVR